MLHYLNDCMFTLVETAPLHTVSQQTIRIVTPLLEADPFLSMAAKNLANGLESVTKSLQRTRESRYTAELFQRDKNRDDLSVSLRDYCKSTSNQTILDPAKAAAARQILDIYSRHGYALHRLNYAQQSLRLNALLAELNQIPTVVDAAGAAALVKAVADAQLAFESVHEQRTEERAAKDFPLLLEGREKLIYWLDAIYSHVDALMTQDQAPYAAIVKELQGLLNETMTAARMQRTRDENRQESIPPATVITAGAVAA
jgi:hypothetical protein